MDNEKREDWETVVIETLEAAATRWARQRASGVRVWQITSGAAGHPGGASC